MYLPTKTSEAMVELTTLETQDVIKKRVALGPLATRICVSWNEVMYMRQEQPLNIVLACGFETNDPQIMDVRVVDPRLILPSELNHNREALIPLYANLGYAALTMPRRKGTVGVAALTYYLNNINGQKAPDYRVALFTPLETQVMDEAVPIKDLAPESTLLI